MTPGPGSYPSHPSKRLFPRGLISDSILFEAVSVFQLSSGRNMRLGSLPGCEISFPFLYTCGYTMRKKRAQLMSQTQVIKVLGSCFPEGTTALEQISSAGPLRGHPSSAAFSLGCLVLSSSQTCELSLCSWFMSLRPTLKAYLIRHPRCSFQFAICPKGPAYPLAFPFS